MSLSEEYRRQLKWRDWETAFDHCPISKGQRVLDLGCGPGDLSKILVQRGAVVTGIDSNKQLLEIARNNCPEASFLEMNLNSMQVEAHSYDGIWCSFSAAYFTNFKDTFFSWQKALNTKSWACFTEIDDLFGHIPLSKKSQDRLVEFYNQSFFAGRYDFRSGHKIESTLRDCGFKVTTKLLKDKELSFDGPATQEVLTAWAERLNRMQSLKLFFGNDFDAFKEELLKCLSEVNHNSNCKVFCSVGIRN
ncbi:MAG: hypothetical protein B7Y39_14755 [Bdellovibrio sp. 28-41-41]|nr:MAG: hypothetical protein B7Y39_14755 [Bdellovibrio sp. 28-41-41]